MFFFLLNRNISHRAFIINLRLHYSVKFLHYFREEGEGNLWVSSYLLKHENMSLLFYNDISVSNRHLSYFQAVEFTRCRLPMIKRLA